LFGGLSNLLRLILGHRLLRLILGHRLIDRGLLHFLIFGLGLLLLCRGLRLLLLDRGGTFRASTATASATPSARASLPAGARVGLDIVVVDQLDDGQRRTVARAAPQSNDARVPAGPITNLGRDFVEQ